MKDEARPPRRGPTQTGPPADHGAKRAAPRNNPPSPRRSRPNRSSPGHKAPKNNKPLAPPAQAIAPFKNLQSIFFHPVQQRPIERPHHSRRPQSPGRKRNRQVVRTG